eukprot:CAMPEP_0117530176 /NCGR_PEP_ID=MMETSP0784-20121206/38209_1 /TAXON_ID=39447 /ORGANISM="" /LENGTH=319 /DNA_ID=CAMNT_0005326513 /DNA_START=27 /DNA_END=982 /DNA_ORIENTATION=+
MGAAVAAVWWDTSSEVGINLVGCLATAFVLILPPAIHNIFWKRMPDCPSWWRFTSAETLISIAAAGVLAVAALPGSPAMRLAAVGIGPTVLLGAFAAHCPMAHPMVPSVLAYRRNWHPRNRFCRVTFAAALLSISLQLIFTSTWCAPRVYYVMRGGEEAKHLANVLGIGYFISCLPLPAIGWTTEAGSAYMAAVHFGCEGILLVAGITSYIAEISLLCQVATGSPAQMVDQLILVTDCIVLLAVLVFVFLFVPVIALRKEWAQGRLYVLWVALEWTWVFAFSSRPFLNACQLFWVGMLTGPTQRDALAVIATLAMLPAS